MSSFRMAATRMGMVALTVCLLLAASATTASEQPAADPSLRDVILRLEQVLHRLKNLEGRIARLEGTLETLQLHQDQHGILWDRGGRPVGYWGIDSSLPTKALKR